MSGTEASDTPTRTLVVGVGNDDRGDDGLGPLAARRLARAWEADPPLHARAIAWTGDPMGLLDLLQRAEFQNVERLVLIDAVVSGAAPGSCRRFGPDAPFRRAAATSSHGLGLEQALALARAVGSAPALVEVWGIEGVEFAAGAAMTPEVERAVAELIERLSEELRQP